MAKEQEWDFASLSNAHWMRLDTSQRISSKAMLLVLDGLKSVLNTMLLQTTTLLKLTKPRTVPWSLELW